MPKVKERACLLGPCLTKQSKKVGLCQGSGSEKNNDDGKGSELVRHEVYVQKIQLKQGGRMKTVLSPGALEGSCHPHSRRLRNNRKIFSQKIRNSSHG